MHQVLMLVLVQIKIQHGCRFLALFQHRQTQFSHCVGSLDCEKTSDHWCLIQAKAPFICSVLQNTEMNTKLTRFMLDCSFCALFLVPAPSSGSHVSIQLQIRYRQRNGQAMLRVITSERDVTDDRWWEYFHSHSAYLTFVFWDCLTHRLSFLYACNLLVSKQVIIFNEQGVLTLRSTTDLMLIILYWSQWTFRQSSFESSRRLVVAEILEPSHHAEIIAQCKSNFSSILHLVTQRMNLSS